MRLSWFASKPLPVIDEWRRKEIIGLADGYRESAQSWRELLLDLQRRGLSHAPDLAIGDGALGFWHALREVFGATKEQRCWFHKAGNVLNAMRKSIQAKAKGHLHDIRWPTGLCAAKCREAGRQKRGWMQKVPSISSSQPTA